MRFGTELVLASKAIFQKLQLKEGSLDFYGGRKVSEGKSLAFGKTYATAFNCRRFKTIVVPRVWARAPLASSGKLSAALSLKM